jgi:hypothetical protein
VGPSTEPSEEIVVTEQAPCAHPTIEQVLSTVHREVAPTFAASLRAHLAERDRDWLIDQLVRLSLDRAALTVLDEEAARSARVADRAARLERVERLGLDLVRLRRYVAEHQRTSREILMVEGALAVGAPAKGGAMLEPHHRTPVGEALLIEAKDVLYALLFGSEATNTHLPRGPHELLTFALPRRKRAALDFLTASTELAAAGTWRDPLGAADDERADNVLIEVQYGETEGEDVGAGIVVALSMINNLQVNEAVLYARTVDVEETSLVL